MRTFFHCVVLSGSCFLAVAGLAHAQAKCDTTLFLNSPTSPETTFIRKGLGEFGAARNSGKPHSGVDIIVRASFEDKSAYAVSAVAAGKVAYARLNGTQSTGYGYFIFIDHENGCYTGYAHLAPNPFTPVKPSDALKVKVGQKVGAGEVIGYFVDTDNDIDSTGNARRTHPEARHQTHFELIEAEPGRSGSGRLTDSIWKPPFKHLNPQPMLIRNGLKVESGSG